MDSIYACTLSIILCHSTKLYLYPLNYLFIYLFTHYFQFPASNYWYMNMPLVVEKTAKKHLDLERTIRNRVSAGFQKRSKHLKQTDEEIQVGSCTKQYLVPSKLAEIVPCKKGLRSKTLFFRNGETFKSGRTNHPWASYRRITKENGNNNITKLTFGVLALHQSKLQKYGCQCIVSLRVR